MRRRIKEIRRKEINENEELEKINKEEANN